MTERQHPIGAAQAHRGSPWLVFILIAVCVLAAYVPAIRGGFIWDDDFHVLANPHLHDLGGLWRIWFTTESQQYYPLVYSSFWLEYRLWGTDPLGYHMVNVAMHAANAMLVYMVFTRLRLRGALAAALIFALHPVHVESVAWVSERKNVLSGLFYLSSFLFYLGFDDGRGRKYYGLSLSLYVLALLSKTVTATLPAVLILVRWMRGRETGGRDLLRLVPFFAVGAVMGMMTVAWEVWFVGARGEEFALTVAERLLLPGRAVWFYVSKILFPAELTFIYERWDLDPADPVQWLYGAGLVVLFAALWFSRRRIGRAPLAAAAYFVLTLFPALGFFNVYPFRYSFVADHFQYLASIGVIGLVAGTASLAAQRYVGAGKAAAVKTTAVAATVLALASLTYAQCRVYKDIETLWRDTIEKNPGAWMAHTNLGNVLVNSGRHGEGVEHFTRAIELNPGYEVPYFNIGNDLTRRGLMEEANSYYRTAIEKRPGYAQAHYNLANNLYALGRLDEALDHYARAVESAPGEPSYRINYGNALFRTSRLEEAVVQYEEALRLNPGSGTARNNLGYVKRLLIDRR